MVTNRFAICALFMEVFFFLHFFSVVVRSLNSKTKTELILKNHTMQAKPSPRLLAQHKAAFRIKPLSCKAKTFFLGS